MAMKKKAVYIDDLHFEHKLWKSQLSFQKDELAIFTHRLEEVVVRWTDKDVLKKVEHFENSFHRHNEVIDTLQHNINLHEDSLTKRTFDNPVAIDHVHFDDHSDMRGEIESQLFIYSELKKEYMRFLTEAM